MTWFPAGCPCLAGTGDSRALTGAESTLVLKPSLHQKSHTGLMVRAKWRMKSWDLTAWTEWCWQPVVMGHSASVPSRNQMGTSFFGPAGVKLYQCLRFAAPGFIRSSCSCLGLVAAYHEAGYCSNKVPDAHYHKTCALNSLLASSWVMLLPCVVATSRYAKENGVDFMQDSMFILFSVR